MTTRLCSCGATYEPTPSGRLTHRTLHGHAPSEEKRRDVLIEAVRATVRKEGAR